MYFAISYSTIAAFAVISILGAAFKGIGNMKTAMYVNVIVNICNTIFNFFLIYPERTVSLFGVKITLIGEDLGLKGAALGTAAAAFIGGGIMFVLNNENTQTFFIPLIKPFLAKLSDFFILDSNTIHYYLRLFSRSKVVNS
ncbi:MAG: hypothetical protein LUC97_06285 [Clostridiales bacterium]|nr:hypothetical protein [Clostridiales bacterium]